MRPEDFKRPKRVFINAPSASNPYHNLHGRVGIAILEDTFVYIYFTDGPVVSQQIDPLYLSRK